MHDTGIRSLMFVPGDNEKLIRKAFASDSDAVIIDLEDAVAPARKAVARQITLGLLRDTDARGGKLVAVRVNAFDTSLTVEDLAAVMSGAPWAVMLPKWQGDGDTLRLGHYLDALEAREALAPGVTRILTVATETAEAVLALSQARAPAHPRLWGMLWGGEDLSAAIGANGNREASGTYTQPFRFARSQCLYAANALGVVAIDAVQTNFRDLAPLEAETREALRDGFSAKAAIHPAQVGLINDILSPTTQQLAWSHEVMQVLAEKAVALVDGKMVDIAHKRIASRLLARAEAIGARGQG